jgi:hypothetical protein
MYEGWPRGLSFRLGPSLFFAFGSCKIVVVSLMEIDGQDLLGQKKRNK